MSRYRCEKISCVNEVQCGTRTERSDLIDQQRDLEVSVSSSVAQITLECNFCYHSWFAPTKRRRKHLLIDDAEGYKSLDSQPIGRPFSIYHN